MKKFSIIILALICYSVQAQKWDSEWGLYYTYANPTGVMGNIIQQGHGGSLYYGWVNPGGRFAVGLDLSVSLYGHDKSRQEYEMGDGTFAPMDVVVFNTYMNIMVYTRWYLTTEGLLRPYLVGKFGYTRFMTDLNIYDPDDWDHCEPLDHDVLYKDGTFVASGGAGVKIDLSSVFRNLQTAKFYFDTSINFAQGGEVRYMNADANSGHYQPAPDVGRVTADFINTQTQIVHEHHVGYLYQSAVQMTEIRVGFSMHLSKGARN